MHTTSICNHTFSALRHKLASQEITVAQVALQCLANIDKQRHLNAFIHTYDQEVMDKSHDINQKVITQSAGPLAGMVVGLKDLVAYQDHPIHAGSKILKHYKSPFNATLTQKLIDSDALIIGHQNCDEFGMGSTTENPVFGTVGNPLDPSKVAGGSSGGSAAAVKANMCHASIGTDTGGSVRQPAAFCGLVGLKPTYGRISRYGVISYASSLDTVGILSNSIEDCARVLEVIAGPDHLDHTSLNDRSTSYVQNLHSYSAHYKVAFFHETLTNSSLQPEIQIQTTNILDGLKKQQHVVDGMHVDFLEYILPTYYVLANAEASTNLARFDGIRYGYRSQEIKTSKDIYIKTRTEGFGPEVKKRIILGTFVLSNSYCDTLHAKAQRVRMMLKKQIKKIFDQYDFIILPTTTTTAFEIGQFKNDPVSMYWSDIYTVLASIVGYPAISIPNGVDHHQMPIGLQIIAPPCQEDKLLAFCHYLQNHVQPAI